MKSHADSHPQITVTAYPLQKWPKVVESKKTTIKILQ